MAKTAVFENKDYQYNQALNLVLHNRASNPASFTGIKAGAIHYNHAEKTIYYGRRSSGGIGDADSWQYLFAFKHTNVADITTLDVTEDRLLIWDASLGTYHTIAPEDLTSSIEDIYVKVKSGSLVSGFLSEVLVGQTNGGIYYDTGAPTDSIMKTHLVVNNLVQRTTNLTSSFFLATSASGDADSVISQKISIAYMNEVLSFIKLSDTPSTYVDKGGYVLQVKADATAVVFNQFLSTVNGGTNKDLSGATNGSLLYFNSTEVALNALSPATAGYVLSSGGAALAPTWIAKWTSDSYADTFEDSDWTPDVDDFYITVSTHGLGTGAGFNVQIYNTDGTTYSLIECEVEIDGANITLRSNSAFDGYYVITKVAIS
jgi:hypothetical protein